MSGLPHPYMLALSNCLERIVVSHLKLAIPVATVVPIGYNIEQHMRAARVAKWQTR
jgi:hypothetical protein